MSVPLFVARTGAAQAAVRLGDLPARTSITGSFAVQRLNSVAAPSLLGVYYTDVAAIARALGLLRADEGLTSHCCDRSTRWSGNRTVSEGGLTYMSPTLRSASDSDLDDPMARSKCNSCCTAKTSTPHGRPGFH